MESTETEQKDSGHSVNRVTTIFYDEHSKNNFINIKNNKGEFALIDINDFILDLDIFFQPTGLEFTSNKFNIESIFSSKILYYPSSYESVFFAPVKGDSHHRFAKRQYSSVLNYIEYLLDLCKGIIDSPLLGRKLSNKPYQLEIISKRLPEYRIASVLRANYCDADDNSIIKHLSESRQIDKINVSLAIKATKKNKRDLSTGISLPHINQQFISSSTEYRCYVFGNEYVLVKFSRKNLPHDIVDIHYESKKSQEPVLHKIARHHIEMIDKIVQLTSLKVFSVDFFYSKQNGIKLLEINPLSTWFWLPSAITSRVEEAFSKFITEF